VARRRGDYRQDFAVNPFLTDRSLGFNAGPRLHWGPQNDPNTYRHNLFGFFIYESLDSGFTDERHPERRFHGKLLGVGTRYDYSNVYAYDNPTAEREARLFADWFDTGFDSDFGFVRFGARAAATAVLRTPRTIGAVELLAGFEQPLDRRGVPV